MKNFVLAISAVSVILVFVYCGWRIKRIVNYNLNYESQVKNEVQRQLNSHLKRIEMLDPNVFVLTCSSMTNKTQ